MSLQTSWHGSAKRQATGGSNGWLWHRRRRCCWWFDRAAINADRPNIYDSKFDVNFLKYTPVSSNITLFNYNAQSKVPKSVKIAPELAKLTLFHGTKFKSWEESARTLTYHMHSFSESRVRSLCRHNHSHKWILYNQTHMSRTFPSGTRVDSSNYR